MVKGKVSKKSGKKVVKKVKRVRYVIIRGPLAVGKSSVAQMLASEIGGEYISIDQVVEDYELGKRRKNGYIPKKSFLRANEIIVPLAKKFIRRGRTVVFDGNFYWESQIEDLIEKMGKGLVFTLKAPVEVCIARDIERGKTHGEEAARAVHAKVSKFDMGELVDAERKSIEEVVKEIREAME